MFLVPSRKSHLPDEISVVARELLRYLAFRVSYGNAITKFIG